MSEGWVKIHRKIMTSETFSALNAIQKLITIYIILDCNHKGGWWHDKYKEISVYVDVGETIVSRSKIANEWFKGDKAVTEQKVRTTINKLKKLGFLTTESTNHYTKLKVLNYNIYQEKENETNHQYNQQSTSSQPALNQPSTTNKNDKNVKNEKNDKNISSSSTQEENPFLIYQQCFGVPNAMTMDIMNSFIDDGMEKSLVAAGIRKAAENAKGFAYAKAILQSWYKKGILTLEQAQDEEQRFKLIKGGSKHGGNGRNHEAAERESIAGSKTGRIGKPARNVNPSGEDPL